MKEIRMLVLGLVVVLLIALAMAGLTAVNRVADYRDMTASKSLHQLTLEARDDDDRGPLLLAGAGLAALALVYVGAVAFLLPAGREFGRGLGRRRRKRNRPTAAAPPQTQPALRVMPTAPRLPMLPSPPAYEEGRYEDQSR